PGYIYDPKFINRESSLKTNSILGPHDPGFTHQMIEVTLQSSIDSKTLVNLLYLPSSKIRIFVMDFLKYVTEWIATEDLL
ncbi:3078_t:CDS:2, partial [Funneliformis geosporum]